MRHTRKHYHASAPHCPRGALCLVRSDTNEQPLILASRQGEGLFAFPEAGLRQVERVLRLLWLRRRPHHFACGAQRCTERDKDGRVRESQRGNCEMLSRPPLLRLVFRLKPLSINLQPFWKVEGGIGQQGWLQGYFLPVWRIGIKYPSSIQLHYAKRITVTP